MKKKSFYQYMYPKGYAPHTAGEKRTPPKQQEPISVKYCTDIKIPVGISFPLYILYGKFFRNYPFTKCGKSAIIPWQDGYAPVAQWIEHRIPVPRVGGSSPFRRTITDTRMDTIVSVRVSFLHPKCIYSLKTLQKCRHPEKRMAASL